jgi:hypothetical protein
MIDQQARAEDIRFLAETGECLTGAARRLGMKVDALEKWATFHGLRDELNRLRAREPHLPVDQREINRRNAERRWAS